MRLIVCVTRIDPSIPHRGTSTRFRGCSNHHTERTWLFAERCEWRQTIGVYPVLFCGSGLGFAYLEFECGSV